MTDINFKLFSKAYSFTKSDDGSPEIPEMFNNLTLDNGKYFWGIGSTDDIDEQGERVILSPETAQTLETAPYNKIYVEHNNKDFPAGIVQFSRMVDGKHIILAKANDAHPQLDNIWGSVQNGSFDSFSVAGDAKRTIGPLGEKIAQVNKLREASLTSMPINPNASLGGSFEIAKSFFKTNNGHFFKSARGGLEILDNIQQNKEVPTMPNGNISIESLSKTVGELAETVKKGFDEFGTQVTQLKENFTAFKKAAEEPDDEETTPKDDETPKEDAIVTLPVATPAVPVVPVVDNVALAKSMDEVKESVTKLEKSFTAPVKQSRSIIDNPLNAKPKERTGTPLLDMAEASMRNAIPGGAK